MFGIDARRIEFEHFAMMIDRIVAIFQRGKVTALDCFFKRSLQSFDRAQPVERLDVFGILFESQLGKTFRFARQIAKLVDNFRINLVIAAGIETLRAVERRLQPPRLVKRLDPNARGQQLWTGRMMSG